MKVEQQALGADECETLFIFAIMKVIALESFAQLAAIYAIENLRSPRLFIPSCGQNVRNINDRQKFLL